MLYTLDARGVLLHGRHHFVADNATVIGSVVLEDEASVWFNTVIPGDNDIITIGARSNPCITSPMPAATSLNWLPMRWRDGEPPAESEARAQGI